MSKDIPKVELAPALLAGAVLPLIFVSAGCGSGVPPGGAGSLPASAPVAAVSPDAGTGDAGDPMAVSGQRAVAETAASLAVDADPEGPLRIRPPCSPPPGYGREAPVDWEAGTRDLPLLESAERFEEVFGCEIGKGVDWETEQLAVVILEGRNVRFFLGEVVLDGTVAVVAIESRSFVGGQQLSVHETWAVRVPAAATSARLEVSGQAAAWRGPMPP